MMNRLAVAVVLAMPAFFMLLFEPI